MVQKTLTIETPRLHPDLKCIRGRLVSISPLPKDVLTRKLLLE